jgi:DNA polymerase elongation subunit (family B)
MEKIRFFPMDINYKVIEGKAVLNIYGRTMNGEQICISDSSFDPYFYVIQKEGEEISEKLLKIKIDGEEPAYVIRTEKVNRKLNGKEVLAVKVFTNLPSSVPMIRDVVKGWDAVESTYEFDILFVRKYLIDKNITLFTVHEAEGEFALSPRSKVPVLNAESIAQVAPETLHNPRVLAFDIETYSPFDMAIDAEKNPIIITWRKLKKTICLEEIQMRQ